MSILRTAVVGLAVLMVFVRLPAQEVERLYSRGVYIRLQNGLTPLSNVVPLALLDLAALVAAAGAVYLAVRLLRRIRAGDFLASAWTAMSGIVVFAAVVFLLFMLLWGLNYQRLPLTSRLDYSADPPEREEFVALAREAVEHLNALHAPAHLAAWPEWDDMPPWLGPAFTRCQHLLGEGGRVALPGRPKFSLFTLYFQRAGVDGMTAPLFLEVLVNQSLLPFERPFVVAHEWAHLAGYANEAEANFIGWLTCLQGPVQAQYSGWLFLYSHALAAVPEPDRGHIARLLDDGPMNDLRAINLRLSAVRPMLRTVSWTIYDRYLRANRVDQGIRSYDRAILLVLGTTFEPGWVPVLRSAKQP